MMKQSEFYKWHNKMFLRNATNASFDFHETVKLWVMLVASKKYKKSLKFVTTEFNIPGTEDKPDVYLELLVKGKKEVLCYEVQKELTNAYRMKIIERDQAEGINTIIIPLHQVPSEFESAIKYLEVWV